MQLLDVDDNKGDVWLIVKDAGFEDDVNVVLTVDQAQELHSMLGHWLQDYMMSQQNIEDALDLLVEESQAEGLYGNV